eukprot:3215641-Amphidinium_carterae.1
MLKSTSLCSVCNSDAGASGTHGPQAPVEQSSSSENPPKGTSADAAASGGGGWWKPVAGGQAAATQSQRTASAFRTLYQNPTLSQVFVLRINNYYPYFVVNVIVAGYMLTL